MMAGPAEISASSVMKASFLQQQAVAAYAYSISLIKQRMCFLEVLNWFIVTFLFTLVICWLDVFFLCLNNKDNPEEVQKYFENCCTDFPGKW